MNIKWIDAENESTKNKVVFCRVDLNVPIGANQKIEDDTKIKESLETINFLTRNKAKLIIASHLGRPETSNENHLSLEPVSAALSALIGKKILFVKNSQVEFEKFRPGEIALLENLRFNPGEEKNDDSFAKKLSREIEVYVGDAFAVYHREHASVAKMPTLLKERFGGFLLKKEISALLKVKENKKKSLAIVLGGSKVNDKLPLLRDMLKKASKIIIGGAMAYTFLRAKNENIGKSILHEKHLELARQFLLESKEENVEIFLPVDHINQNCEIVKKNKFKATDFGVDIGPETIKLFCNALSDIEVVFANGPMGVFEKNEFSNGTKTLLRTLSESKSYTVVGGGDSIAALKKFKLEAKISHVSTGGGASLRFLENKKMPGIAALERDD